MGNFIDRVYEGFAAVDRLTTAEFENVVKQAGLSCQLVEDAYIVWEVGHTDAWVVQILNPDKGWQVREGKNWTCYCEDCFQFSQYVWRYTPHMDWIRRDNLKTLFLKNLGVGRVAVGEEFAETAFPQSCFGRNHRELAEQLQKEGFEVCPLVKLGGHPSSDYLDNYKIDSPVYNKYKECRERSGYRQEPCSDDDRELTEKISLPSAP